LSEAYQTRQKRKQAAESAKAKLAMAKQSGDSKLELNDDEWEAVSKQNEDGTWKDEYITVIITSPFVLLFLSAITSSLAGDMRYLNAVNLGIQQLKSLGVDLGELMFIVVLAAVSIKGLHSFKR
ncbi:MAG: hypothetical protein AAF669_06275, partial [Pseudomonadota bacterium]